MSVTPLPSRGRDFGEGPVKQGADMVCGDCSHEISLRAGAERCKDCGKVLCPDCMKAVDDGEAVVCLVDCGQTGGV